MNSIKKVLLYILSIFALPNLVHAHLIGGSGFSSGALHPLSGIDHLLAMLAVGIIATRHGGKAIWFIPATFITSMIIGGIIGILGLEISFVEIGIALSVVFLGIAIFIQKKIPLNVTMAFVAVSAFLHGHAHGSEMPLIANPVLYASGFVLVTTLLHFSGVMVGHYATKTAFTTKLLRYVGAGMGIAGIFLLASF